MPDDSNSSKWAIRFRDNQWRLYDPKESWHDTFRPGGLTRFLNAIKAEAKRRSGN